MSANLILANMRWEPAPVLIFTGSPLPSCSCFLTPGGGLALLFREQRTVLSMAGFAMHACWHCKENAEWRFKDGWGALACADWFEGKCAGEPLDVSPPLGNV